MILLLVLMLFKVAVQLKTEENGQSEIVSHMVRSEIKKL